MESPMTVSLAKLFPGKSDVPCLPLLAGILLASWIFSAASAQSLNSKDMAPPTAQQTAPPPSSIWNQQYLLGDWGGERTKLEEEGVHFDFNDIGDFLSDVSGSQTHHAAYFGRFRAAVDLDLKKLVDVDAEFYATGIYQYGRNLSGDYLGTNTLTSSIAGEESERIDQIWYKQWLFDHHFAFTIGQIAAVNEFGATDFFDILMNDELGYAPNALFSTRQPFSPSGKPGVVLWQDLSSITNGLYVKAGVFTAYDNPYRPDEYGVDYTNDFRHGVTEAFELGYKEPNTTYDGTYKLGVNGSEARYENPATAAIYHDDYNIYGIVEKTVYHPEGADGKLDTKKGLDLLFQFVGEPGDRNPLQYEFTTGGRYTGLIPGRDADKVGFGVIYSDNGEAFSEASQNMGGPGRGGETTLEIDYQYNPAPWLSIQPDVQYIIDPAGFQSRQNIAVLGLRTIVHF
jgi:porin